MGKKKTDAIAAEISFEESLQEIQEIVAQLEDGSLGLEESLERFERGIGLIRRCHQTLEQAEQKIKILTDVDAQGHPVLEDFDSTATTEKNQKSAGRRKKEGQPKDDDSDEFSLF